MLARQLAYITYVRGSMSTLQILLFLYFYGFMPPTLSREEPNLMSIIVDDANEAYCEMDGVLYRCLVSNAAGDVTSETATLTVNVKPVENPKPAITTQPADVTVNEGATAAFSVVASNATTYQWYYQKPDTTVWNSVLVNGTSATYTLTTAERHNGNTYRCTLTNEAGETYSSTATLTVI